MKRRERPTRTHVEFVGSPARLPAPPSGRVAVVDVAFASGEKYDLVTEPFIAALGERLALWCDHHEHPLGWSKYRTDPRFLLVPNYEAHACPELVTPQVAERAGALDALIAHGDFDGLITAAKLLRGGREVYPGSDEDARAIDSPGRGHALSPRGQRLAGAVDEAVATFTTGARRDFLTDLLWAQVDEHESPAFAARIDAAAAAALEATRGAEAMATALGREELPGLYVMRLQGRQKGRLRKALLGYGEERASVAVMVETEPNHTWLTAATFDTRIDLNRVDALDGGRSDYRYAEPTGPVDKILREIARVVEESR